MSIEIIVCVGFSLFMLATILFLVRVEIAAKVYHHFLEYRYPEYKLLPNFNDMVYSNLDKWSIKSWVLHIEGLE